MGRCEGEVQGLPVFQAASPEKLSFYQFYGMGIRVRFYLQNGLGHPQQLQQKQNQSKNKTPSGIEARMLTC